MTLVVFCLLYVIILALAPQISSVNFQVEWFDRLASTNALMRDRFSQGLEIRSGQMIAAREQTAGRGRQDRKWLSAPNQNLCFSLFVQTGAELAAVPSLTMAAALAVNDLLRSLGILSAPGALLAQGSCSVPQAGPGSVQGRGVGSLAPGAGWIQGSVFSLGREMIHYCV